MKEMNSVLIYRFYVELMNTLLKDDSEWKEAMTGLLNYGFEGIEPQSDNVNVQTVYRTVLPTMKRAKDKYLYKVEQVQALISN